jgi:hypothetical protein
VSADIMWPTQVGWLRSKPRPLEAQVLAVGIDGHDQQADDTRRVGGQRAAHFGGSARVGGRVPVVADLEVEGGAAARRR